MVRFFLLSFLLSMNFVYAGSAPASSTALKAPNPTKAEEITINANEIHYITADNTSKAIGNARAEKGSGEEKQILTADEFTVHFKEKPKDNKSELQPNTSSTEQDIETIDAKGNVVMVKGDLTMKAEECVYSSEMAKDPKKADQIDCNKNVSVTKAGNYIQGDEGTVNLKTGVYTVKKSPSSKRKSVNALIKTPSNKRKSENDLTQTPPKRQKTNAKSGA